MIIFSAWAGMIVFILNNLVSTVDGFITAGYSATSQTVSELGIGPNGWIQNVNFFLTGFLIATFAIGFRQAVAPVVNRKLKKTTVLLVISGIATAPGRGFYRRCLDARGSGHSYFHSWFRAR